MSTDESLVMLRSEHTRAMRRCRNHAPNLMCRGSGGVLHRPAGSARGSARSHAPQRKVLFDGAPCAGWWQLPYAGGGIGLPAPCTPGRGIAPGPQIDVVAWELSGADGNQHR